MTFTVSDTTPRYQYTASAAQTVFTVPFEWRDDTDLAVYVNAVPKTVNTDYTLTGAGVSGGGSATFSTAMAGGEIVTIYRDMPVARTSDQYATGGQLPAVALEASFDDVTLKMQQLEQAFNQTSRIPITEILSGTDMQWPVKSARLGKYARWDSVAGKFEPADISATYTSLTQSLIGAVFYPQTTGEVAASVTPTSYIFPPYTAERYGFAQSASGATNAVALQSAINSAAQDGIEFVIIESTGQCSVNANNIYFHYDAALNPNFPSAAVVSPINVIGQGYMTKGAFNNGLYQGTVLDFGTQGMTVGNGTAAMRGNRFEDLSMVSSNATRVLRFRKVSGGVGWNNFTVFQKGAGDGVEMDDCFYVDVGYSIIYASTQAGVGAGRGLYCHNSSQAAGEYRFSELTADSFGIGRLFGEAAAGASAQNTVHNVCCQSISCGEGLVIGRGVKASSFVSEHIETSKVAGIRCYQSCQAITLVNPYLYNPAATEADIVLGKTAAVDSDNAWKQITIINPLILSAFAIGISVIVTSNCKGLNVIHGALTATTPGVGNGIDFHGTICRGATIDQTTFTSFLTDITDLTNVEYYRASGQLGRLTYNAPTTHGSSLVNKRVVVTYAGSMAPDVSLGNIFQITATNGTAFTIDAPTNPLDGQMIEIQIRNTSGGALGVITWNAVFKMSAWTSPATAFSRSIRFFYNGTNWIQEFQATVDVPN